MKTAKALCGLMVVCWSLAATQVLAQRVQFGTPVQQTAVAPAAAATSPIVTVQASGAPVMGAPMPSPAVPAGSAAPSLLAAPQSTIAPPATYSSPGGMAAPGVAAPGAPYGSPTAPVLGSPVPYSPPAASFNGNIQPGWDPYASPCATPNTLLPQDPYLQPGPMTDMASVQKFVQHINFEYDWFAGTGSKRLGINDVDLSVTFAFPLFGNPQTPLRVTPGFAVHYWAGPTSELPVPADMPARTYDGYLDFCWNPQISPWFGAELNFRTGIYSDFNIFTTKAIHFMGKGLAVIRLSEHMELKAGVWYLDRNEIKILPAGGIVWTPNPDVYFNILFPNPKMGKKLTTVGSTEWWMFAAGEYGGGNWLIKRESGLVPPVPSDGSHELVDYNDIEISAGLEFKTVRNFDGTIEVGGSFSRQLIYQSNSPHSYFPSNTVFLRATMMY